MAAEPNLDKDLLYIADSEIMAEEKASWVN